MISSVGRRIVFLVVNGNCVNWQVDIVIRYQFGDAFQLSHFLEG